MEVREATAFFGDRRSNIESVEAAFPDYAFVRLKQTHSDTVVLANDSLHREGDAHISRKKKLALCIFTADCMPVLIHDPEFGWAAAIHAGWRGIENEIIVKTCRLLHDMGSSLKQARAWIGPHITLKSFEVDNDVAHRLEHRFEAVRGFSRSKSVLHPHENPDKSYVDLIEIARAQLASCGISSDRAVELAIDTFTSEDYFSHRREREKAGRQLSFIALK